MFLDRLGSLNNSTALTIYIFCTILMLMALIKILSINNRRFYSIKNIIDTFVKNENYKMIIIARTDISMGKGKLAAQCSHAAVACFKKAKKVSPEKVKIWEYNGSPKIVLKTNNIDELLQLHHTAVDSGIISYVIRDAGRTQIDPGTMTACAFGPDKAELIDQICGHLKLL